MSMIFMITPETGDAKTDRAAAVNACSYFRMSGVAVSPVLAFDYLGEDDWLRDFLWEELLDNSQLAVVMADEVTERMIKQIRRAQEKELPIHFYDADRHEIDVDALVINKRIGPGLRKMIMDVNGLSCSDGGCP